MYCIFNIFSTFLRFVFLSMSSVLVKSSKIVFRLKKRTKRFQVPVLMSTGEEMVSVVSSRKNSRDFIIKFNNN